MTDTNNQSLLQQTYDVIEMNNFKIILKLENEGSIAEINGNLSKLEIVDDWTKHSTVFSLIDFYGNELIFFVISERLRSNSGDNHHIHSLIGQNIYIEAKSGTLLNNLSLPVQTNIYSKNFNNKNFPFTRMLAAFRVFIDEKQYLFSIINKRVISLIIFWRRILTIPSSLFKCSFSGRKSMTSISKILML